MKKDILVVEDNPVVLKLVSEVLRRKGHFVRTAGDGLTALNLLENYVPDIIFLDLLIPKIDGEMLCKIIHSKAHLENAYVIILSGIATESGVNLGELGADAYIAKGNNISGHIDGVLEKIENETLRQDQSNTYGFEDVYPRDATLGLLRSKQHLEVILDNLADGLVEITPEGTITFINSAAETFLAIPQRLILGINILTLFGEEHHQYLLSLLENALRGQRSTSESDPLSLKEHFVTLKIFSLDNIPEPSCIVILHDITERKQLNDKLNLLSKTDLLTGAYNRRAFYEYFEKELNAAKRYSEQFSLLLIDIDSFKKHNDALGHNIGDEILKEVVEVFNSQIRQVDFLFRWGGDEFIVLLPRIDIEGARVIAERIRSTIEKWNFSATPSITISLGLSSFRIGDNAKTLVNKADVALYRSKNAGRNRLTINID